MMVFFELGWGKVQFGKKFLKSESPTLKSMVVGARQTFQFFQTKNQVS